MEIFNNFNEKILVIPNKTDLLKSRRTPCLSGFFLLNILGRIISSQTLPFEIFCMYLFILKSLNSENYSLVWHTLKKYTFDSIIETHIMKTYPEFYKISIDNFLFDVEQ